MPKRNETLSFTTSFMGTNRASASTTIVDTSYPMTYTSKWATAAAGTTTITETDEGKDVYFVIDSDNVPDGTRARVIVVAISTGIDTAGVADFNNYVQSTDVIINGGKAAVKVSIKADQLTENRESFYAALLNTEGGVLTSAPLYINDTSKTPAPTYEIGWYSSSAGTTPINTINEGSTAWLIVKTTQIRDNHGLGLKFSGTGISLDDFPGGTTTNDLESAVNIIDGIGKQAVTFKADLKAEGNEVLTVGLYDWDVFKASANITIIDTSKETVITIPSEYNGKGVILVELFKKILKRSPNSDEHVRVVVPSNIELQAFPRVVGRRWIRSEQAPGAVLATPIYDDTFYPAQHGISLVGMPSPGLVTVDVYGKIIGGPVRLKYGYDPKNADNTFTYSFPYDYSASADRIMVANDQTGILIAPLPNPTQTLGFAIYSPVVFNLIVRNGAMVVGHGGEIPNMWGYLQDYNWATGKYEYVTEVKDNRGGDAIYIDSMEGNMRVNVIGNGVLAGGGGSGGNGGGLLSIGMTHWDLGSLATYYGAYGGGGAPYGGCIYHHDGATSDPVCPVAYRRVGSVTGGRRLGDTGTYGMRSLYSGGSATLTQGGSVGPRFQFGPNGKGYHFDFTPGVGGGIGQRGQAGSTPIYKEYQWSPNKVYTFTAEERTATSAPGPSGTTVKMVVLNGTVTYDSSLT